MDIDHDLGKIYNTVTTLDPGAEKLTIAGTTGVLLPNGTTLQRPTLENGIARYNSTTGYVEVASNSEWINERQIVFDVIYRPLKTRLLNDATKAGAITIGGLEMFIQQGAAAFQYWIKRQMPIEKIRQILEQKLISQ